MALSQSAGTVELAIDDEGPGIPERERSMVLERFSRGLTGAGTVGSGLGLSIAVAAARRAQGALKLETGSNGMGLLVRMTLPVVAPAEQVAA